MADPDTAAVLRDSSIARGLMGLNAQQGRFFVAQRLRMDRLDELDRQHNDDEQPFPAGAPSPDGAAAAVDDVYDPIAEDIRRQELRAAQLAPIEGGGFDEGTYEDIRMIQVLHKATLPPTGDVWDACRRGDLPLLRNLVEGQGHDINRLDRWDASPLYYACLCGHTEVVQYLLNHGARCEANSWDGERCFYVALSDNIRRLLQQYQAANRGRGPLFAFTYRVFNNSNPVCYADVSFHLPADNMTLHAHRAILAARSPYMRKQFGAGGRWAGRRDVTLPDARLSGVALNAVLSYIYTERLLCPRTALRDAAKVAKNLQLAHLARYLDYLVSSSASSSSSDEGGFGMVAIDLGAPYAVGGVPEGADDSNDDDEEDLLAGDGTDVSSCSSGAGALPAPHSLLSRLARHGLRRDIYRHLLGGRYPVVPPAAWDLQLSLDTAEQRSQEEDAEAGGSSSPSCRHSSSSSSKSVDRAAASNTDVSDALPPIHHDLELVVHGQVFRCHRAFVAGRSRYFESLLRFEEAKMTMTSSSSISSSNSTKHSGGVFRASCSEVTPYTMGLVMEWLYCDVLRPVPRELLLEALHAADVFMLTDGIKPLLVAAALEHITVATVVDLFAAADLYNLHRLTAACARFTALELDAVLELPEFEQLIAANAASIVGRQATDSVPMLDDVKTEVTSLFGASVADILREAAQGGTEAGSGGSSSKRSELRRRLALLDAFAARLGLRCFSADQEGYRGSVFGGQPGADDLGGSGGTGGAGSSATAVSYLGGGGGGATTAAAGGGGGLHPVNIPGVGVRLVGGAGHGPGGEDVPLTGQLFRELKGISYLSSGGGSG